MSVSALHSALTNRRDHAYWQDIIERFHISGLTQKQFCLQNGMTIGSFKNWYYRLRTSTASSQRAGFIPITPEDDDSCSHVLSQPCPPESPLILELPNAIKIIVSPDFGAETLSRLLSVMGSYKC